MRVFITSFIALLLFTAGTSPVSAQTNFGAQVTDSIRSVIDAFTGNSDMDQDQNEERARALREKARERAQNFRDQSEEKARMMRQRAEEQRNSFIDTASDRVQPPSANQLRERDRENATNTDRGDRVRDAFERATRATGTPDRTEILERIRERRQEHREEIRGKIAEIHRERIHAFAERMFERLQAAIDRLERLSDRIESRIEKFEQAGIDVADANAALEDARADIAAAQSHLNEADSVFEDIKEGEIDPRNIFTDAKELIKEMTALIRNAHASLVDVIRMLKATLDDNIPPETDSDDESEEDENENETNNDDTSATTTTQ